MSLYRNTFDEIINEKSLRKYEKLYDKLEKYPPEKLQEYIDICNMEIKAFSTTPTLTAITGLFLTIVAPFLWKSHPIITMIYLVTVVSTIIFYLTKEKAQVAKCQLIISICKRLYKKSI